MTYLETPLPKTALEIFHEWTGGKPVQIEYSTTSDLDFEGNDEKFSEVTFTNHDDERIAFENKKSEEFKITDVGCVFIFGGHKHWNIRGRVYADAHKGCSWIAGHGDWEDVASMLADDNWLRCWSANDWPLDLGKALGK